MMANHDKDTFFWLGSVTNKNVDPMHHLVENLWQQYKTRVAELGLPVLQHPCFEKYYRSVWLTSNFVAQYAIAHPTAWAMLFNEGAMETAYTLEHYQSLLQTWLQDVSDEASLMQQLRIFRHREMVRIAWRDLAGYVSFEQILLELSAMADSIIQKTLSCLMDWHCQRYGEPQDNQGPASFMVVALGKLGGEELNFSSDIDLMFVYSGKGETSGNQRIHNAVFFDTLAKKFIATLHDITEHGFVYRVDMRLRPFGESGALVISHNELEIYLQQHGRSWERYAMVKARILTGAYHHKQSLLAIIKAFVYRRYVDYSAIESLRDMKQLVQQQVKQLHLENNIKLGEGGIREIEFIAQVFQLIRGGRDLYLQQHHLLTTLDTIKTHGLLPQAMVNDLRSAYIFLRQLEHTLQMREDKQTQVIIDDALLHEQLTFRFQYSHWEALRQHIMNLRKTINSYFSHTISTPNSSSQSKKSLAIPVILKQLWYSNHLEEDQALLLKNYGYDEPEKMQHALHTLYHSARYQKASKEAKKRCDQLMPLLIQNAAHYSNASHVLLQLIPLVEAIIQRSAYIVLLLENPQALHHLLSLGAASTWVIHTISQYPILLDELLGEHFSLSQNYLTLLQQLQQQLLMVPEDDGEKQLNCLQQFKCAQTLKAAATYITETVTPSQLGQHLSDVATVILQQLQPLALRDLVTIHGLPPHCITLNDIPFAIVAYGGLGGEHCGFQSDLDLVFLYEGEEGSYTRGQRPLSLGEFYTKLAQRIMHLLALRTLSGQLYGVDVRLRPSGNAGLLVSPLNAFIDYQLNKAWTWEHQAMVRARLISGNHLLKQSFQHVRQQVLTQPRDMLVKDINTMWQKINEETKSSQHFHLKLSAGGIMQLEFMVQYAILRWAKVHPELLESTHTVQLVKQLQRCGRFSITEETRFLAIYETYGQEEIKAALEQRSLWFPQQAFLKERQWIQEFWHTLLDRT